MAANLSFLPWVRQGAAGAIATVDTLGAAQPAVADVSVALSLNGAPLPSVAVRLRGPADVVGIDAHQVVRTDPRPDTSDFEPNAFPSIEFARADFPWLFTPARATTNGQLRPWLCLVVVRQQDGVQLTSSADAPLPTLRIASPATAFSELPNLKDSWAWAHSQVASEHGSDRTAVGAALNGAPHLSLSRLVCPRMLAAATEYIACVVPTFELGRKAGLGLPIADADLVAARALAPAWAVTATAPTSVVLPVYYSWRFRTGEGGDFESLARALTVATPAGLGRRPVTIGRPGFAFTAPVPASTTVQVEGALLPLGDTASSASWTDAVAPVFEASLARIVNQPGLNLVASPSADPLLAPPLYGRWHAARTTVTPGAANWFDRLNLDPRWRTAAALGTQVVQEHQEALMASAWEQAADVARANQRLRQLQLSMAVGERLHARHLSALSEEMTLRFAAPAFSRLRAAAGGEGRSLLAAMTRSSLPVSATRAAMRRVGRQRGPLSRRVAAQGVRRSVDQTWVARLNFNTSPAAAPRPDTASASLPPLPTVEHVATAVWNSGFVVAPEGQPPRPLPTVDPLPPAWDYPGHFRAAAVAHLSRIRGQVSAAFVPHRAMVATADAVRAQLHPRIALAALARAAVALGDTVLPATAPGIAPLGTETVMLEPAFPQPMYEALKEKSQDLLLPGLDRVEPDTVVGLRTNRAFVEAYMIGLNVEMGRELLWRGFPTDQQGTYFRHFWGTDAGPSATADIADLRTNLGRPLGAVPGNAPADQFVLLVRSRLLRRYPNAIIYLTPAANIATTPPPADIFPIFNGSLDPDVSFVGFPIAPAAAVGSAASAGYYVVIQEHPTEPRFGLDVTVATALAGAGHLPLTPAPPAGVPLKGCTWARNSAHMAEITRRLPVRITIHASELVGR